MGAGQPPAPWQQQSLGLKPTAPVAAPAKAVQKATEADLAVVAKGESLHLLETWQGSFTGSKLDKAGTPIQSDPHKHTI